MSEDKSSKPLEGYSLNEEQLIDLLNFLEGYRKLLFKHPESQDYIAIWRLEEHVMRRLNEIAWNKYQQEKGIKILKV